MRTSGGGLLGATSARESSKFLAAVVAVDWLPGGAVGGRIIWGRNGAASLLNDMYV
ncbi:hypothetical protein BJY00DRAFT_295925 [Aspergillus carlsbadensis]|nr:hypothetical protein BJY00DRAFT_295925 [Aspergillus carlsbadensis]